MTHSFFKNGKINPLELAPKLDVAFICAFNQRLFKGRDSESVTLDSVLFFQVAVRAIS